MTAETRTTPTTHSPPANLFVTSAATPPIARGVRERRLEGESGNTKKNAKEKAN